MPRRARRGSNSSVETVNLRHLRWRPEDTVLQTMPPESKPDEWQTFELKNAVVLNKDGTEIENLLNVKLRGPFIVRGIMVIDDKEQREQLITRVRNEVPIEIFPCNRYSIGDDGDESSLKQQFLWAAGRGAWFEIKPSAAYKPTYKKICDAIQLYYTIYDIYLEFGTQKLDRMTRATDPLERISPVFLQYAIKLGDGSTVADVAEKCRSLAEFLITQMLDTEVDTEDDKKVCWKKTYFYRWLTTEHKEVFEETLKARRKPHSTQGLTSSTKTAPASKPSSQPRKESPAVSNVSRATSQTSKAFRKPRKTRSNSNVNSSEEASAVEDPEPESPQHQTRSSRSARKSSVTESSASHTPLVPSVEDQGPFESVLHAFETMFDELPKHKPRSKTQFLNKIYFANQFPSFKNGQPGCHRVPLEEVLHYNAAQLLQRLDKKKYGDNEIYSWLEELSKTAFNPVALKPEQLPFSIIPRNSKPFQPRTNSFSSSAMPIRSHVIEDHESDKFPPETPQHRRGGGKSTPSRLGMSSLRPVKSSKKRRHAEIEDGSEPESPVGAKRSHYFSDADDDDNMERSEEEESASDTEQPIKLVIRADRIPSTIPRGPDNTWTCDQEDCDYVVRGGDEAECKARIHEHFLEHAQQEDRVQLAMTEGTRGHLPIKNLLEKLKSLGENAAHSEMVTVDGVPLPEPIKRNLIV